MALPEEFEFELEALRATYGDDHVEAQLGGAAGAVVALPVAPRGRADHECFVAGRLVLRVGAGYPADAPSVELADAKGARGRRTAFKFRLQVPWLCSPQLF